MTEKITIEVPRPVNPGGFSFIKVVGGVLRHNYDLDDSTMKAISKALQRLGFKIEEAIGVGNLFKGKIVIDLDEKKIIAEDIEVWKATEKITKAIEVEL